MTSLPSPHPGSLAYGLNLPVFTVEASNKAVAALLSFSQSQPDGPLESAPVD
jgi:hypothetical protein